MAACPSARSLLPSPTMHGVWKQAGIHVQQGGRASALLVPGIACLPRIPPRWSELETPPAFLRECTGLHLMFTQHGSALRSKGNRPKMTLSSRIAPTPSSDSLGPQPTQCVEMHQERPRGRGGALLRSFHDACRGSSTHTGVSLRAIRDLAGRRLIVNDINATLPGDGDDAVLVAKVQAPREAHCSC